MIRTVLKVALLALVANAMWHLFGAFSPQYKFQDGVEYAAHYRTDMSDDLLREKILDLASQFEVPVTAADVAITHRGRQGTVDLSYVRPVELAPGLVYRVPFSVHVDTIAIKPPGQ
jgi:hypothetical protein